MVGFLPEVESNFVHWRAQQKTLALNSGNYPGHESPPLYRDGMAALVC